MNTNGNTYTVVYTTLVCVLVAAILAVASQVLKPRQAANEKAETISQILVAAGYGEMEGWKKAGNTAVLQCFKDNVEGDLQVYTTSQLKAQNYNIKQGKPLSLPVYRFNNGITVLAVYGAGLWGPVWGYIAFEPDMTTIAGAYFDHESETPGLGGKIKDDPSFRNSFKGKVIGRDNKVEFDAISGATMPSRGLEAAIDTWMKAYREN